MRRLLWLVPGLSVVLVALSRAPLADVHWDAPIYLYQAKRFAETPYLSDVAASAEAIAAQIAGAWPADEDYSEAFWRSSRLGHIALLGVLVDTLGSTAAAIGVAHWMFVLAMPLGLLAWSRVASLASRRIEPDAVVAAGLGLGALLFVLSDVHAYLSGNLVSEVMSFALGGASVWALLASIRTGGAMLAAVSGLLAFAAYTMRAESVWAWLAFMIAYLPFAGSAEARACALQRFVVAGGTALLAYAVYACALYPLADPRHYLRFAASLAQRSSGGVHAANLVFVAGGMLWLGTLLALRQTARSRAVRFGVLWFLLAGLPSWGLIAAGAEVQTRMLIGIVPPLILLSAAGWSSVLRDQRAPVRCTALAMGFAFVLLSRPPVYAWLLEQPGAWRVQYLGALMSVPRYERIDYRLREMEAIGAQVYAGDGRPVILISAPSVAQEYLNLVRFFGPAYPEGARLALVGDPTNPGRCDGKRDTAHEPVRFCTGFDSEAALRAALARHRVLQLRRIQDPSSPGFAPRAQSGGFVLEEFGMRASAHPRPEIVLR